MTQRMTKAGAFCQDTQLIVQDWTSEGSIFILAVYFPALFAQQLYMCLLALNHKLSACPPEPAG